MSARALVPALPSGARAPGAFVAPSSPGFTASSMLPTGTPVAASSLARCVAAEASPPWGRSSTLVEAPPATLQEARDLRDGLTGLVARERAAAAEFLIALAEFDRRRGWEALGHGSLFAFLTRDLRLSPATAYTRLSAARLIPGFPEVETALRDGRLCVTSTGEVAKVLTRENQAELLPRFFGLSSREAKEVVASLRPKELPRRPELITRLAVVSARPPEPPVAAPLPDSSCRSAQGLSAPGSMTSATARMSGHLAPADMPLPPSACWPAPGSDCEHGASGGGAFPGHRARSAEAAGAPLDPPAQRADFVLPTAPSSLAPCSVEPLTADHRRLHLTVRTTFLEKLRAARRGLDHSRPGASLEEVLETALDLLLENQARRRGEVKHPRTTRGKAPAPSGPAPAPDRGVPDRGVPYRGAPASGVPVSGVAVLETPAVSPGQERGAPSLAFQPGVRPFGSQSSSRRRAIPAATRREVWSRDGLRCQFPIDGGGVCGSRRRLELDHLLPIALGGLDTADNLRVVCRAHNLAAARAELGEPRMADRRKRPTSPPSAEDLSPLPARVVRAPEASGPEAPGPEVIGPDRSQTDGTRTELPSENSQAYLPKPEGGDLRQKVLTDRMEPSPP